MDQFKEFQGKDLDECIKEACAFFDLPRERLEVEIVQDARTGIFGIVGARKAKIRVRRLNLENVQTLLDGAKNAHAEEKAVERTARHGSRPERKRPEPESRPSSGSGRFQKGREQEVKQQGASHDDKLEESADFESYPATPFEELDKNKLEEQSREVISRLLTPIAGRNVDAEVDLRHGTVRAKVEWEGDAGLLIGREGQTLAALQYLAGRILSRSFQASVRVQLEIGDYKSRQDNKLREIALALAEKAKSTGRSWSTRPLTSYHRRVIHMVLQDDSGVMTRSSGDGPLKRVVIAPRREQS